MDSSYKIVQIGDHVVVSEVSDKVGSMLIKHLSATYVDRPFDWYLVPNQKSSRVREYLEQNDNEPFLTGIDDVDMRIILSIYSLTDVFSLYQAHDSIRTLLNKAANFALLKEVHGLHYVTRFQDLVDLSEGLKTLNERTKTYYTKKVDDFRVDDRVTFEGENYKITAAKKKTEIQMVKVNAFGKVLDIVVRHGKLTRNESSSRHRFWYWTLDDNTACTTNIIGSNVEQIERGILLYPYGPRIGSLESVYLKYKTLPGYQRTKAVPEVGMIVSVADREQTLRALRQPVELEHQSYVISEVKDGELELISTPGVDQKDYYGATLSLTLSKSVGITKEGREYFLGFGNPFYGVIHDGDD